MKHSTDINHQPIHYKDSHSSSFGTPRNAKVAVVNDDPFLSLLKRTLQSSHIAEDATSFVVPRPPLSFDEPLDDPVLEPLPLKINVYQAAKGVVSKTDKCISLDIIQKSRTDLGQNMTFNKGSTHVVSSPYGNNSLGRPDASRLQVAEDENVPRFRAFQDKKWKDSFQRLLNFKHKFGHCCVPHSYVEDRALAGWVKRQRHQYKKFVENDPTSTLTIGRVEQLEAIGFVWNSHFSAWLDKFNELKNFQASRGHCNVPSIYKENVALSTWVKGQRRQYKLYISDSRRSTMTKFRFEALKSLGFVFEPRQT